MQAKTAINCLVGCLGGLPPHHNTAHQLRLGAAFMLHLLSPSEAVVQSTIMHDVWPWKLQGACLLPFPLAECAGTARSGTEVGEFSCPLDPHAKVQAARQTTGTSSDVTAAKSLLGAAAEHGCAFAHLEEGMEGSEAGDCDTEDDAVDVPSSRAFDAADRVLQVPIKAE